MQEGGQRVSVCKVFWILQYDRGIINKCLALSSHSFILFIFHFEELGQKLCFRTWFLDFNGSHFFNQLLCARGKRVSYEGISFLSLSSLLGLLLALSPLSLMIVSVSQVATVSLLLSFIILESSFKCQFASCESWVSLPHWMLGSAISPEYQALGKCQCTIRDLIVSISTSTNGKAGWSCPKNMMWKEGTSFGVRNPELKPLINSDMSYNHNNSDLFSAL